MPTTAHTYKCIQRFDPALSPANFDEHDHKWPLLPPEDAEPSRWRAYLATVEAGEHDPDLLDILPGAQPIVYTLRPLTRPEIEACSEAGVHRFSLRTNLVRAAFALVAVDGPRPLSALDLVRMRARGDILPHIAYDADIWSDDDVCPESALMGLGEMVARRWNLSQRERTFRRPVGSEVGVA